MPVWEMIAEMSAEDWGGASGKWVTGGPLTGRGRGWCRLREAVRGAVTSGCLRAGEAEREGSGFPAFDSELFTRGVSRLRGTWKE
jgi:hypothetical protein